MIVSEKRSENQEQKSVLFQESVFTLLNSILECQNTKSKANSKEI